MLKLNGVQGDVLRNSNTHQQAQVTTLNVSVLTELYIEHCLHPDHMCMYMIVFWSTCPLYIFTVG